MWRTSDKKHTIDWRCCHFHLLINIYLLAVRARTLQQERPSPHPVLHMDYPTTLPLSLSVGVSYAVQFSV